MPLTLEVQQFIPLTASAQWNSTLYMQSLAVITSSQIYNYRLRISQSQVKTIIVPSNMSVTVIFKTLLQS
jgi:hypothetical protein